MLGVNNNIISMSAPLSSNIILCISSLLTFLIACYFNYDKIMICSTIIFLSCIIIYEWKQVRDFRIEEIIQKRDKELEQARNEYNKFNVDYRNL